MEASITPARRGFSAIDPSLIKELRAQPVLTRPRTALAGGAAGRSDDAAASGMQLGSRVRHDTFGEGIVVNYEGAGAHARVQVNFESAGAKWLVLAYARLQSV
jgi:DNA helicase-2/ATP-dependent DNA helicase PcrA